MSKKIVIALGGNALGNTPSEQLQAVKLTATSIVDMLEAGNNILIGHGNGPQVGMINLAMSIASEASPAIPAMPFAECGAMSQGYIGYHLQNALQNELNKRKLSTPVVTLVTQVLVDENDKAFQNPTKPIGNFYTKEEAERIREESGYTFKEDAGRGYRRVVASPKPVDIIEKDSINALIERGHLVIAGGGGGIPVISRDGVLEGVAAVIDKDFTSAKLAELADAEILIILTAVEKVAIRFGKPDVKWLDEMSIEEAQKYIEDGEFAPGSMLPKVQAAIEFVSGKKGRKALITSLDKAGEALEGKTGTIIVS